MGGGFLLPGHRGRPGRSPCPSPGRPPVGPAALLAHAESIEFRAALESELRGPAAGVVEEPTQLDQEAADVFDVLARHIQVPLSGMEPTGRSEMAGSPVGLRAAGRRLLRLAGGLKSKDAVEHPLLRGRQRIPADPLRHRPGAEVLVLHQHLARPYGQRPAGPDVRESELEAALPVDPPDRADWRSQPGPVGGRSAGPTPHGPAPSPAGSRYVGAAQRAGHR